VLASARAEGRLLQHLLGSQVFLDHEYEVGPDVLVPRPETELLASIAIEELASLSHSLKLGLEVGLGSGVLSIELLARFPALRMIASELTAEARARALSNANRILKEQLARLIVITPAEPSQVLEPFAAAMAGEKADFLISNPPYLAKTDPIDEEILRHEPHTALFPPIDPLLFYREIAAKGAALLKPEGAIFLEIAPERGAAVAELFDEAGWTHLRIEQDLAGRDRILMARSSK
jgi:release factor glutamine methyltransferase